MDFIRQDEVRAFKDLFQTSAKKRSRSTANTNFGHGHNLIVRARRFIEMSVSQRHEDYSVLRIQSLLSWCSTPSPNDVDNLARCCVDDDPLALQDGISIGLVPRDRMKRHPFGKNFAYIEVRRLLTDF